MVEKPLVTPSVPTHPICGHEGTLWLVMPDRNKDRTPARPQGGQDKRMEKTRKKSKRHNTRQTKNSRAPLPRRKSKPISPKIYAQLLNTKRKRKVHEVSKPMASLSLIPFPFALHSLSSSRLAVIHGHHKPKQGREMSYTFSSQFHKVSP